MNRRPFLVSALAAILVASVGCGGGSSDVIDPDGTHLSLAASPASPITGSSVTFTVTAQNSQIALEAVSIDFENDGTWDDVQLFAQSSIVAAFTHVYVSAGAVTARAEVKDANNARTSKTLLLIVSAPPIPPVSYRLHGVSSAGDQGACEAFGPPATCAGCSQPIGSAGLTGSLGSLPHGTPVTVTQAFDQLQYVSGTSDVHYSCGFSLDLYAGTPGSEVQFGHGACTTNSGDVPERLTCSVSTSGIVP